MRSIRVKLWSGMMALVMVVILLLWLFQVVFLKSFYIDMRVADVREQGVFLVQLLADGSGISPTFIDQAEKLALDNNLSIELLDMQGHDKYSTGSGTMNGNGQMMMRNIRLEVFQQTVADKEVSVPMTHPRFGSKFVLLGFPQKIDGKIVGVLLITMPLAPVEETAAILGKQLIYITFILLVAAVVISYLLSKSFTRSILEIKRVSEKMASGDFSDSVKSASDDEIGQLARTINTMGSELAKTEQLRKDLIANVSHELRTPLSLIRGYAETIRDISGQNPAAREKHLEIIIDESERLSRIVDDILNLSQWQGGYLKLELASYELNASLDEVLRRYELLSVEKGIKMQWESCETIRVSADRLRIEQVLYNLINNAFNYTLPGGAVTVWARDKEDKVRVEVTDTGEGMAEDELHKIWDRYYKGDENGWRARAGTGLGLAIVKSILEAHQIAYGVTSQKGKGTTFWFELQKG